MKKESAAWCSNPTDAWKKTAVSLPCPRCPGGANWYIAAACVSLEAPDDVSFVAYWRDGRGYALPGGKMDEGDVDIFACGSRETFEEVGITIAPDRWQLDGYDCVVGSDGNVYMNVLLRARLSRAEVTGVSDPEGLGMAMVSMCEAELFPNNRKFMLQIKAEFVERPVDQS